MLTRETGAPAMIKSLCVRLRLTLWYLVVLLAAVLVLFSRLLYGVLSRSLIAPAG